MDRITKSLMNKFSETMEINLEEEAKLFEAFSTYTVVSKIMDSSIDTTDIVSDDDISGIVVGSGGDMGIDGLAISLNGQLITDLTEIEDILNENSTVFEAVLVFVQSKTSSKFEGSEIRNFGDGIVDFLSEEPQLVMNDFLVNKWEITSLLIENADKIKKFVCKAFYVTTGKWVGDKNLSAKINKVYKSIDEQNIFKEIEITPIDAEQLREMYQSLETKLTAKIEFPKKVLLPEINGVSEAYIGYIEVNEYLNLIEDESKNLRKSIFYDNVRDYQGDNDVNLSIAETLSSNHADRLAVLNNGVTVIAEQISVVRESVTLQNYQIVNGCQTSYVIYFNKNSINGNVYLPIKIVATTHEEIVNEIIIANNSQTEVKKEQLLALSKVQKNLETFYATFKDSKKQLFYERRSKQFGIGSNVEKVRIVTISNQLRSFCAMFLNVPHLASRYYGKLFTEYSSRAFNEENNLILYYTSAYALYKLEYFIRNKNIEQKYRKYKYHILLMLRYHISGSKMPQFNNSKKINVYCEKINKIMWDNKLALEEFRYLVSVIDSTIDDIMSNEVTSKKYTVDNLLGNLNYSKR